MRTAVLKNKNARWMIPAGFFTIVILVCLIAALSLNNGVFSYMIDDAYIHLALAENVAQGHYGVNVHELSAPSSSILWTYLLAPFARTSIGEFVPFAISFASAIGIIYVVASTLYHIAHRFLKEIPLKIFVAITIFSCVLPIAVNLPAMVFIGMEHALQALCAVAVVAACIRLDAENEFPWWGIAAIIIGPLVRYENAALSFLAIGLLFLKGRRKIPIICTLVIIASLAAFSLYLYSLGLGYLPTSILAKSRLTGRGTFPFSLIRSFGSNLKQRQGPILFAALLLIFLKIRDRKFRNIVLVIGGAVLAHFIAADVMGRRYTAYLSAMMFFTLFYLYFEKIQHLVLNGSRAAKAIAITGITLITLVLLIVETVRIPVASNNIYEQQYQMHRLALLYGKPVAINDLGWVAFKNDNYVLDLWGLASLKALQLRTKATSPDWTDQLCREKNVELVMIYDDWFNEKPANWIKIGDITLSRRKIAPAGETVSFYTRSIDSKQEIIPVLVRFKKLLPARVIMNIY